MESRETLRVLAEVSESQWGMVTSAQATARGVSYMNLTRLAESGDLVRLSHGVYKDAGAPSGEHEELRAAWLATDPAKLAYERLGEQPGTAVVSGESASRLHAIGDLRAMKSEFTTPNRKQSQRSDIRYRTRVLPERDVTVRAGLPVTTRERTIADLVEDGQDLSIVGNALRDAAMQSRLDVERLTELLSPLAERNGHHKGDGDTLLEELLRIAGIDLDGLARQLATIPDLGAVVTARYLDSLPKINPTPLKATLDTIAKQMAEQVASGFQMDLYPRQLAAISEELSKQMMSVMPGLSALTGAIAPLEVGNSFTRIADQLTAANWAALASSTRPKKRKAES